MMGLLILLFDNTTNWDLGYCIILDPDLSMLDFVGFDDQTTLTAAVGTQFNKDNEPNILILTDKPDISEKIFPNSQTFESTPIFKKLGLRENRYVGALGLTQKAFDLLDILRKQL